MSPTPVTSADVSNLRKELDRKLLSMEARDCGICPIREELHSQCFDELIRQITLNCAERGYWLVSVRDEYRMVKSTLQRLYDSSIVYGMKKALLADKDKTQMNDRINSLEKENKELVRLITELEEEAEEIVRVYQENRATVYQEHEQLKKNKRGEISALKIELDKQLSTKMVN